MKICIDGLSLHEMKGIGLNTYCYGVLKNLLHSYPKGEYNIIWNSSRYIDEWKDYESIKYVKINMDRARSNYLALEEFLKVNEVSVYHSPNNGFSIPSNKACKYVMTVQDLLPVINKNYVDEKYRKKFETTFPTAIERADKIVAVSNSMKDDLMKYFNVSEDKIEVIYPLWDWSTKVIDSQKSKHILEEKYGIKDKFILYVGSIHGKKNIKSLITAMSEVVKYNKDVKLVLVGKIDGKRSAYYEGLRDLIACMNLRDSVIFTGSVEQEEVFLFLKHCICQLNFSVYDGFPMAVMEGMSSGTPLICTNTPAIREVAGDCCRYVDIKDSKGVSNSILEVINNKNIRDSMRKKGIDRSKEFNWRECSDKMIDLYKSLT